MQQRTFSRLENDNKCVVYSFLFIHIEQKLSCYIIIFTFIPKSNENLKIDNQDILNALSYLL